MTKAIRILRRQRAADPLVTAAIEALGTNAVCLKRDREISVWRVRALDQSLVVKQWRLDRPKRRIQALFRATPAFRQWHNTTLLQKLHIPAAPCLAIARAADAQGPCEWLVMEFVKGKTVLQHLADRDLSPRQEHRLAEAVGRLIAEYKLNDIRNRDTKPSNLILRDLPPDANRNDDGSRAPGWLVVIDADLAHSGRSKKHPLLSSLAECVGTACLPRRSVLMRVLWTIDEHTARINQEDGFTPDPPWRRTCRHAAWRTLTEQLARHGDPTPKVNPLDGAPCHQPLP